MHDHQTNELTSVQRSYLEGVPEEYRGQIASYLKEGVDVVIYRQNDCVGDVPPFAVAPLENKEYWIGCWDSCEEAVRTVGELGLKVAMVHNSCEEEGMARDQ